MTEPSTAIYLPPLPFPPPFMADAPLRLHFHAFYQSMIHLISAEQPPKKIYDFLEYILPPSKQDDLWKWQTIFSELDTYSHTHGTLPPLFFEQCCLFFKEHEDVIARILVFRELYDQPFFSFHVVQSRFFLEHFQLEDRRSLVERNSLIDIVSRSNDILALRASIDSSRAFFQSFVYLDTKIKLSDVFEYIIPHDHPERYKEPRKWRRMFVELDTYSSQHGILPQDFYTDCYKFFSKREDLLARLLVFREMYLERLTPEGLSIAQQQSLDFLEHFHLRDRRSEIVRDTTMTSYIEHLLAWREVES
jgi:hypothetical protein